MSLDAIHDWIGSDRTVGIPDSARVIHHRGSSETVETDGLSTTTFRVADCDVTLVSRYDAASLAWHPIQFPCRTVADVKVLTEFYEDVHVEVDTGNLEKALRQTREIGDTAVTAEGIGISPLMYFVEWLAGVENAHYLLADYPDDVERLFEAIHRVIRRKAEVVCEHSPADTLYMVENTSTTLISPDQYRRYCSRHLGEYARIAQSAGRNMVLHMCGHLKALLPDLARIPVRAFEAFTSPTVGNTSLLDGRLGCPNTCLIGGTNAALWMEPADAIIAQIQKDLDVLPHHRGIVVTSAGVMPPACKPETIKKVGDWVKAYPVRM
jgi:uroporphyrinogen-III decarboxylase